MAGTRTEEWTDLFFTETTFEFGTAHIARQRGWMPRMDLLECESHLLIRADLAGVNGRNIRLTVDRNRNVLCLSGYRSQDFSAAENYRAYLLEIQEGEFSREIVLPDYELDFAHTFSSVKNGILTIRIPIVASDEPILVVESLIIENI